MPHSPQKRIKKIVFSNTNLININEFLRNFKQKLSNFCEFFWELFCLGFEFVLFVN
ncbi:hypothetical protein HFN_1406 [Helicobacter fennelliae MRY12-0050]|uniref:Uncharacterized protein n=1 Tax=Helicobacter fennelliae MRY12-0050 TaxID=1325130 RepID=T1DXD0_9HELI|nr:hypothetical protein HFN_1406 [Helicobacter fennelliae MRY12-0050]